MTMDALLDRIEAGTDIDSEERAREVLQVTLETFGQRVSREEAKDIAGGLPDEIETWVIDWDSEQAEAFSVDEFLERVAGELDVSEQEAQHLVQATMDAVDDELGSTELSVAQTQLPQEYDTLLESSLR